MASSNSLNYSATSFSGVSSECFMLILLDGIIGFYVIKFLQIINLAYILVPYWVEYFLCPKLKIHSWVSNIIIIKITIHYRRAI